MPTKTQRTTNGNNGNEPARPRGESGEGRAPQPRLKHGKLAREACSADENPADFDRLLREFEDEIQPRNAIEFMFVWQMADARWRLLRLVRWGYLGPVLYRESRLNKIVDPRASGGSDGSDLLLFGLKGAERSEALRNLAYYAREAQQSFSRAKKTIVFLRGEGRCIVERR